MDLINIHKVEEMTTLSRATIYRMIKGKTFPEGKLITANRRVWNKKEIDHWIEQRMRLVS